MASGSFTGTTGNKYIKAKIEWSSTSDIMNNQSTVTATLYYAKSSNSTAATYGSYEGKLTINGSSKSFAKSITLNADDSWVSIGSHTVTVAHDSDGSKSIVISATGGIPSLSFSTTNCSATVLLDKIGRGTIPTFGAATQTIGSNVKINLNAADSGFYHTVTYSWGSETGTIGTNLKGGITWLIPMSFCTGVPNGTQGTLFVTVETFTSNGMSLGKATRSTPCNVPESVVPTISAITVSDTGGNVPSEWGVYVRGKSTLHVNVSAAGVYYSRITAYSIRALGVTIASNNVDVGVIPDSGTVNIEVTVTDSRGRTATATATINVVDYTDPEISMFRVERANSYGTPVDNGTFARIQLAASGSSVGGKNTVEVKIYHMQSSLTDWTLARTINVAYSIDEIIMIADMVASRSYAIKVEVSDAFGTTIAEATLRAEGAVMGWMPGGIGVSVGKSAEEVYKFDSAWRIHGRRGADFDDYIDAPAYWLNGKPLLQLVDILTAYRGTNMQLGVSSQYTSLDFTKVSYSLSQILTVSEGGILIPAGIRAVKISGQVCFGAATAGARYIQASINNFDNTVARSQRHHVSTSTPETHVIAGGVTTVSEGDVILFGAYGNESDWIYGNYNQTYLTVEAYV